MIIDLLQQPVREKGLVQQGFQAAIRGQFLRRLEVLKNTFGNDTRLVLSTESELFQMLKEPGEEESESSTGSRVSGGH
ncbi:MAG: hypothetical protein ACPG1A_01170 [Halioglobus sp.]